MRQRLWRIVAKRCVVAAGAIERPIVFAGNDTPGVMMASAVRTYVKRFAATPAKRIALFTNNEDGWRTVETALARRLAGRRRHRRARDISPAHRALASKTGFPVLNGVGDAASTAARMASRKIAVALGGSARAEVEADGLAVSGGWNPAVGLTSYHRGRPKWRDDIAAFVPDGAPPGMVAAGAANGDFGLGACLREGFAAGAAAAADSGHQRQCRRAARRRRRGVFADAALACRGQGKGLRRLPERRDRLRHRAGAARGLRIRSSI